MAGMYENIGFVLLSSMTVMPNLLNYSEESSRVLRACAVRAKLLINNSENPAIIYNLGSQDSSGQYF